MSHDTQHSEAHGMGVDGDGEVTPSLPSSFYILYLLGFFFFFFAAGAQKMVWKGVNEYLFQSQLLYRTVSDLLVRV